MDLVIDTNVIVHYARRSEVARQIEADHRLLESAFRPLLSAVTLGEAAAFANAWGERKREQMVKALEECVIVEVGRPEVVVAYAVLHTLNRDHGCNLGQNDLWIAATANALRTPLMTADRDFDRLPPGTVSLIRIDAMTGLTLA